MINLVRLSGYRLNGIPPEEAPWKWSALRTTVGQYVKLLENLPLGFYRDDTALKVPPVDLLMSKLNNGEIYFAFDSHQNFIGMAAITNISYGRNAYLEAIGLPGKQFWIGKALGELLTYAFKDFDAGGLGLKKLKAGVIKQNGRVIKLLLRAGFRPVGELQHEALHGGVLYDMILLELLNPKYFAVEQAVINGSSPTHSDIPSDSLQQPGDIPAGSSSERGEWEASSESSQWDNGQSPELAEPGPVQQLGTGLTGGSVRPSFDAESQQLVPTE